jgi:hypothetical protein
VIARAPASADRGAQALAAFYHPFAYAADRGLGFAYPMRDSLDLQPQN